MTPQKLAERLNGRKYGEEMTPEEEKIAKDHGLIVIFGYSDDNIELRGAIHDEVGAWSGTSIGFNSEGLIQNKCDQDDCPYHEKVEELAVEKGLVVDALWDHEGYSWHIQTAMPHSTFDILEDGEKYCRGIVISLTYLQNA